MYLQIFVFMLPLYIILSFQEELKQIMFRTQFITAINLSGIEQLTDMFFYLYYSEKLEITGLESLHLTGKGLI